MCLSGYYEDSVACDARSIAELAVESCSKGIFAIASAHGKSPCFSRWHILTVVGVDEGTVVLVVVDGTFFLD